MGSSGECSVDSEWLEKGLKLEAAALAGGEKKKGKSHISPNKNHTGTTKKDPNSPQPLTWFLCDMIMHGISYL